MFNGCGSADHPVLEEVAEKVYTIDPDAKITIQSRDGAVLVYGGEANEIRVQSTKRAYSQKRLNEIAIDISTRPGSASIFTKFPAQPKWGLSDRSGTVDYTLVVPATASISTIDVNAGEVLVDSMHGHEVRAQLNDGRIFARDCVTDLDLTIQRGTLTLTYDWWVQRKFSAHVNLRQGNVWLFLRSEAAFHLLAQTAQGKIANDFNDVPVSANSSSKGMQIDQVVNGGGAATIKVRVAQGDIKIGESNP
jgi:Putative adhesin